MSVDFSLNVFNEFSNKNICHYSKSLKLPHLVLEIRGVFTKVVNS